MSYPPGPFANAAHEERPDLAEQLGVESCVTAPADLGFRMGVAVVFKHSGIRFGVIRPTLDEALEALRAYIAEAPYGRNRWGEPWKPRS